MEEEGQKMHLGPQDVRNTIDEESNIPIRPPVSSESDAYTHLNALQQGQGHELSKVSAYLFSVLLC